MTQADHITVIHGSMTVDVPRKIFKGRECTIDWDEVEPFKRITQSRYPWISDNAIKVIINKAQMEMMRVRDEETNGREYSKTLAEKGKLDDAIAHLKLRLELNPNDAKAWYDLGELLFKKGDAKGGFDAFKKGDELYKKR
ncbi:MAG: tetratricopeptide repeat protein [Thermoplasmata archaeon]|nr:tetratricopeptide repeat protein [Thermoplasmata archaeon]MBR4686587.1 tetratricopeptide repeat protein [Candidatus Methanomethylophilaceae archaeon]WII07606.1 tetratricopeptide repeat protein [Methanomassiliicoccales archaeon LGM-RCC1]